MPSLSRLSLCDISKSLRGLGTTDHGEPGVRQVLRRFGSCLDPGSRRRPPRLFRPIERGRRPGQIERLPLEPGYLAAREARLRADYVAPTWADCLRSLIGTLAELRPRQGESPAAGKAPSGPLTDWRRFAIPRIGHGERAEQKGPGRRPEQRSAQAVSLPRQHRTYISDGPKPS